MCIHNTAAAEKLLSRVLEGSEALKFGGLGQSSSRPHCLTQVSGVYRNIALSRLNWFSLPCHKLRQSLIRKIKLESAKKTDCTLDVFHHSWIKRQIFKAVEKDRQLYPIELLFHCHHIAVKEKKKGQKRTVKAQTFKHESKKSLWYWILSSEDKNWVIPYKI